MRVYQLQRQQRIRKPLAEVFEFFSKPENLAQITPSGLGFVILTPPPIPMRVGTLIDYVLKVGGLPVHWRTMVTTYEPPFRFVDEQLKGPYLFWHHTHQFQATDEGTIMSDNVRYALPFGALGSLAHTMFIRRQLRTIFDFRHTAIEDFFSLQ